MEKPSIQQLVEEIKNDPEWDFEMYSDEKSIQMKIYPSSPQDATITFRLLETYGEFGGARDDILRFMKFTYSDYISIKDYADSIRREVKGYFYDYMESQIF